MSFDPLIDRLVAGRYRIKRLLARGGMGKIYLAEQELLGREVALKVMAVDYHGHVNQEFHKRFLLEASTLAKLRHPNTVTVFDYGAEDGLYFIAMELLEGQTLTNALREEGPFDPPRALRIARQVCRALREAHSLGVIHRDLKPANIFLSKTEDEQDFVKVLDFGLVKQVEAPHDPSSSNDQLTKTGVFIGSPKYMAPEQIRNEVVDQRVDVYSLGIVLYQMLTGFTPFQGRADIDVLTAHLSQPPPPMNDGTREEEIPDDVEAVVHKALEKRPHQRFADMNEFLLALQAVSERPYSASNPGAAPPPNPRLQVILRPPPEEPTKQYKFSQPTRRVRSAIVVGVVVVLGAASAPFVLDAIDSDSGSHAARTRPEEVDVGPVDRGAPAPPPAPVLVSLRSDPEGAIVVVENSAYGPTPAEVEWTGRDAEPGRRVTFRFQKQGFRDVNITRVIRGPTVDVRAELEPLHLAPAPVKRRPHPVRTSEREPTERGSGGGGLNFRESPY